MTQFKHITALLTLLLIARNPSRLQAAASNQSNILEKAVNTVAVAGTAYISHLTDQNQSSVTNSPKNNLLTITTPNNHDLKAENTTPPLPQLNLNEEPNQDNDWTNINHEPDAITQTTIASPRSKSGSPMIISSIPPSPLPTNENHPTHSISYEAGSQQTIHTESTTTTLQPGNQTLTLDHVKSMIDQSMQEAKQENQLQIQQLQHKHEQESQKKDQVIFQLQHRLKVLEKDKQEKDRQMASQQNKINQLCQEDKRKEDSIQALEAENQDLRDQVQTVKAENQDLANRLQKVEAERRDLENDVRQLKQQSAALEARNTEQQNQINTLQQQVNHLQTDNQQLTQENQQLTQENQQLTQENQQLTQENQRLHAQIQNLQQNNAHQEAPQPNTNPQQEENTGGAFPIILGGLAIAAGTILAAALSGGGGDNDD